MNRIHPKKLLHSKWTAVQPRNREKHFLVTEVLCDAEEVPQSCTLEAVLSRRAFDVPWRELKDASRWRMGWN
jgi:tryptophan-rich hypothetical protein